MLFATDPEFIGLEGKPKVILVTAVVVMVMVGWWCFRKVKTNWNRSVGWLVLETNQLLCDGIRNYFVYSGSKAFNSCIRYWDGDNN